MSMASLSRCSSSGSSSVSARYFDDKWKLSKKEASSSSSSSSSSFIKKSSKHRRRCGFAGKCARLVKQQRARFYIMRRCIIMLICWRDYS